MCGIMANKTLVIVPGFEVVCEVRFQLLDFRGSSRVEFVPET